jgi:hypothetical protein
VSPLLKVNPFPTSGGYTNDSGYLRVASFLNIHIIFWLFWLLGFEKSKPLPITPILDG